MSSSISDRPIGIFDSGVGGISVLKDMVQLLPNEKFIYYADSLNAPYGTKDNETIARLSRNVARFLVDKGIKTLVVACNTATAVAINQLRAELDIPVIGMEPAVKPAVELGKEGKVLVMATPVTLKQEKFNKLLHRYDEHSRVIPLPCPGLVELVEKGITQGKEIKEYLSKLLANIQRDQIAVVVLGCTHYVFVRDTIKQFFPSQIPVIDGNCGTAKRLLKVLEDAGLRAPEKKGEKEIGMQVRKMAVKFYTSGDPHHVIPLCQCLLNLNL
ncbi:glutamate racemase [Thermincola potens JR]|uniref:Glutamate racemase n=2 Tax=Thermincola TaxID=278993 RepID=D5XEA6_THEPJ|nr:glutamate racemase [Thermincola potens JR]